MHSAPETAQKQQNANTKSTRHRKTHQVITQSRSATHAVRNQDTHTTTIETSIHSQNARLESSSPEVKPKQHSKSSKE